MSVTPFEHQTVSQLHASLKVVLARAFPAETWVVGEVASFKRVGDRLYFDLVDRPEPFKPPSALVKCVVHPQHVGVWYERLKAARLKLADGVPLRVRCKVASYAPQGSLQLMCSDVDPLWTVGQLVQTRESVVAQLKADGVFDHQQQLVLPTAPLRVAVLSSAGSHAQADFLAELGRSMFAFEVTPFDVLVQGEHAAASIVGQLGRVALRRSEFDVVCLVRGGGSRTDLAAFDDIEVSRAICLCPLPVLVGVGHELDRGVADEVAFLSVKTPTAAAAVLVDQVAVEYRRLLATSERLSAAVRARLGAATQGVSQVLPRLHASTVSHLSHRSSKIDMVWSRLAQSSIVVLTQRQTGLEFAFNQVRKQAPKGLQRETQRLDSIVQLVAALSPEATLRRGFSLTRRADGSLVCNVEDLVVGETLVTSVANGSVTSCVERVSYD